MSNHPKKINSLGFEASALFIPNQGYWLDLTQIVDYYVPRRIRLSTTWNRRSILSGTEVVGREQGEDRNWSDLTVADLFMYGFERILFRGGALDGQLGKLEDAGKHGVFLTIERSNHY